MCEFISWIEKDEKVYMFSNNELNTKEGRRVFKMLKDNDIRGHGTIREYWGLVGGVQKECEDFSTPKNFPKEIVEAIKAGQYSEIGFNIGLLNTGGKLAYEKVKAPAWEAYKKVEAQALEAYEKVKAPAWEAYKKVEAQAWEAYEKVKAPAWEAYEKVKAPAWEAYKKVEAQAWEAYEKVEAQAWEAYKKVQAQAFWEIFKHKKYRNKNWR